MVTKLETFIQPYLKKELPDVKPGDTVRVYQKVKEGEKERVQIFEGVVIAMKHGRGISGTLTVRKISEGVGVERTFPLHSPTIEKIEVVRRGKVRRAKLYYLREVRGRKAKLKAAEFGLVQKEPAKESEVSQETVAEQ